MDLSFSTGAGNGGWSLAECAAWAKANGFDAIRPNANGTFEPSAIIQSGGEAVKEILDANGIYLAALTSHCNLLGRRRRDTGECSRYTDAGNRSDTYPRRTGGGDVCGESGQLAFLWAILFGTGEPG